MLTGIAGAGGFFLGLLVFGIAVVLTILTVRYAANAVDSAAV